MKQFIYDWWLWLAIPAVAVWFANTLERRYNVDDIKELEKAQLYDNGPELFTLKLLYDVFGLNPVEVKQLPEQEAMLLAQYAHQIHREGMRSR